ncbi:hypothetical protein V494_01493 [Pseudogymnoascus sp. VKM F-4513 (FW-928)]|nr:hypothetical protein V494_01493 [Pseudogymnoascus sp. VKM F-4513 (FW-928)]
MTRKTKLEEIEGGNDSYRGRSLPTTPKRMTRSSAKRRSESVKLSQRTPTSYKKQKQEVKPASVQNDREETDENGYTTGDCTDGTTDDDNGSDEETDGNDEQLVEQQLRSVQKEQELKTEAQKRDQMMEKAREAGRRDLKRLKRLEKQQEDKERQEKKQQEEDRREQERKRKLFRQQESLAMFNMVKKRMDQERLEKETKERHEQELREQERREADRLEKEFQESKVKRDRRLPNTLRAEDVSDDDEEEEEENESDDVEGDDNDADEDEGDDEDDEDDGDDEDDEDDGSDEGNAKANAENIENMEDSESEEDSDDDDDEDQKKGKTPIPDGNVLIPAKRAPEKVVYACVGCITNLAVSPFYSCDFTNDPGKCAQCTQHGRSCIPVPESLHSDTCKLLALQKQHDAASPKSKSRDSLRKRVKVDANAIADKLRLEEADANAIADKLRLEESDANAIADKLRLEETDANAVADKFRPEEARRQQTRDDTNRAILFGQVEIRHNQEEIMKMLRTLLARGSVGVDAAVASSRFDKGKKKKA